MFLRLGRNIYFMFFFVVVFLLLFFVFCGFFCVFWKYQNLLKAL